MNKTQRTFVLISKIAMACFLISLPALAQEKSSQTFSGDEKDSLTALINFTKSPAIAETEVWPGYHLNNISLVMQGNKNDFFFNAVKCSTVNYLNQSVCSYSTADIIGAAVYIKPEKFFETPVGCIRPILNANKIETWIAYLPTYDLLSGVYKTVGSPLSYDDYLLNWVHEGFHVYQILNWEPVTDVFLDQNAYMKGLANKDIYKLMKKEGAALYSASEAKDKSQIIHELESFFKWRAKRRELMDEMTVLQEKKFELSEGTAQYVQYKTGLMLAKNPPAITNEPKFDGFKQAQSLLRDKLLLVKDLDFEDTKMKGNWCYNWGMAQAIILDELYPDWKKDMNKHVFFLEDKLSEVIKHPETKPDSRQK